MEQHRLNINKVTNIKELFHAGWILSDKKGDEIILESDTMDVHPVILKATFITLCEGILNSNTKLKSPEERVEIDFDKIQIQDFKSLAKELTKATGISFSIAIV